MKIHDLRRLWILWMACLIAGMACGGSLSSPTPVASNLVAVDIWTVPTQDLGSKRLYKMSYDGPQGDASFRMALYLQDLENYSLKASDLLGRGVWSMSVRAGQGIWIDTRGRSFCRFEKGAGIPAIPGAPFALPALPSVLLGRLPSPPQGEMSQSEGRWRFSDATGREWSAVTKEGEVVSWSMLEGGKPVAWWSQNNGQAVLSERRNAVQVRWREVARELLGEMPAWPSPPSGFADACLEDEAR